MSDALRKAGNAALVLYALVLFVPLLPGFWIVLFVGALFAPVGFVVSAIACAVVAVFVAIAHASLAKATSLDTLFVSALLLVIFSLAIAGLAFSGEPVSFVYRHVFGPYLTNEYDGYVAKTYLGDWYRNDEVTPELRRRYYWEFYRDHEFCMQSDEKNSQICGGDTYPGTVLNSLSVSLNLDRDSRTPEVISGFRRVIEATWESISNHTKVLGDSVRDRASEIWQ